METKFPFLADGHSVSFRLPNNVRFPFAEQAQNFLNSSLPTHRKENEVNNQFEWYRNGGEICPYASALPRRSVCETEVYEKRALTSALNSVLFMAKNRQTTGRHQQPVCTYLKSEVDLSFLHRIECI